MLYINTAFLKVLNACISRLQGQVGWGFELPGPAGVVPTYGKGDEQFGL